MQKISLILFVWSLVAGPLFSDELTLKIDGKQIELVGKILIEAQDKSLYFQSHDGKLWFVQPEQIINRKVSVEAVKPISKKNLRSQLATELPKDFRFLETQHYLIAYQTEPKYAAWISNLFEVRLYKEFEAFWKKKKLELDAPDFPLVILIFRSEKEYGEYIKKDLGDTSFMVAYYNLQSNRVAMYDFTASMRPAGSEFNDRRLQEILQNPAVWPMITTTVHEGTHQLIFNRGIQTRFAETPLWLNEGLAVYFETPFPKAQQGWREPGLISQMRLSDFRKNLANRDLHTLKNLIGSDELFKSEELDKAIAAYAEAWVLMHFLINERNEQFIEYVRRSSKKKPLVTETPNQRITEFEEVFGNDWQKLDRELLQYAEKLK